MGGALPVEGFEAAARLTPIANAYLSIRAGVGRWGSKGRKGTAGALHGGGKKGTAGAGAGVGARH